jgi:hypothetical protein
MIDVEMLDAFASGTIPFRDGKPVFLEDVWTRVVADGWTPRKPARADELHGLNETRLSGATDCLHPLLQHGDTIYSDPGTPALPGDIVVFQLSERGAKAQNGDSPADQGARIWRKGDGWAKLFCRYQSLDMLLTRFEGNSATATLLACEHPDDIPVLQPVRQIVRDGKLLFIPETHSPQVGLDAASQILSVFDGATYSPAVNVSNSPYNADLISPTINCTGSPIAIDWSLNCACETSAGGVINNFTLQIYRDGVALGSGQGLYSNTSPTTSNSYTLLTASLTDAPSAGFHTYALHLTANGTGSGGGLPTATGVFAYTKAFVKVREVKR